MKLKDHDNQQGRSIAINWGGGMPCLATAIAALNNATERRWIEL
jgi:hypothetical protein